MSVRQAVAALRSAFDRWLFRIGPTERAPIVLGQRRIFVLPTAPGSAFGAALLVMLLAAINYNLSLGYGLVFLIGAIGFVSIVHAFRNLLHLSLSPGRAEPVFVGDAAQFHMLVDNRRDARRPALRLKALGVPAAFSLEPAAVADVTLALPATRRGWLAPGRVVLETTWPLGLIRAWSVLVPDLRCLVYPAPEARPPPLPENRGDGTGTRAQRAGDDDFAGLRTHQLADSPRHVAWKVVARGGAMLTKQFSGLTAGDLEFDWETLPTTLDTEARIARLVAWVLAAESRHQPYALRLPAWQAKAGLGERHRHACLKRLALLGMEDDGRD